MTNLTIRTTYPAPSLDIWEGHRGEYIGLCASCGDESSECEPDARAYSCEGCGEAAVFGAESYMHELCEWTRRSDGQRFCTTWEVSEA